MEYTHGIFAVGHSVTLIGKHVRSSKRQVSFDFIASQEAQSCCLVLSVDSRKSLVTLNGSEVQRWQGQEGEGGYNRHFEGGSFVLEFEEGDVALRLVAHVAAPPTERQ
jgi:hypothetical protein